MRLPSFPHLSPRVQRLRAFLGFLFLLEHFYVPIIYKLFRDRPQDRIDPLNLLVKILEWGLRFAGELVKDLVWEKPKNAPKIIDELDPIYAARRLAEYITEVVEKIKELIWGKTEILAETAETPAENAELSDSALDLGSFIINNLPELWDFFGLFFPRGLNR